MSFVELTGLYKYIKNAEFEIETINKTPTDLSIAQWVVEELGKSHSLNVTQNMGNKKALFSFAAL